MLLYLHNLWDLFVDMSFYIVIGLIFTGLLHAFVKKDTILKHIGKDNTASVIKASIFGVPLPLCSCGVVPTAMYLGKSGSSKGSVVSFLTSTPQTGVDSIIATYGMLGPLFAVYRAVAAFLSGIISGIITNVLCKNDNITYEKATTSCSCEKAGESANEEDTCTMNTNEIEQTNCFQSNKSDRQEPLSFTKKIRLAFTYGFGEFLDDIAVHFVVGLLIAALISTLLPASLLSNFKSPIITMVLMVLIGIPMYICSTASIPIAVSLMLKGVSPGGAFVFLFAGPVTNIASLLVLKKTLGKKVTAIYLIVAALCAICFGLLFDYIINTFELFNLSSASQNSAHEHEMPLYMTITAVIFGAIVLKSLLKQFKPKQKST